MPLAPAVARNCSLDSRAPDKRQLRRDYADGLRICELLVYAFVDTLEERPRVVDEDIDTAALLDYVCRKAFQRRLVREVSREPRPVLFVDDVDDCTLAPEALGNAFAYALRPSSDHDRLFEKPKKWLEFIGLPRDFAGLGARKEDIPLLVERLNLEATPSAASCH